MNTLDNISNYLRNDFEKSAIKLIEEWCQDNKINRCKVNFLSRSNFSAPISITIGSDFETTRVETVEYETYGKYAEIELSQEDENISKKKFKNLISIIELLTKHRKIQQATEYLNFLNKMPNTESQIWSDFAIAIKKSFDIEGVIIWEVKDTIDSIGSSGFGNGDFIGNEWTIMKNEGLIGNSLLSTDTVKYNGEELKKASHYRLLEKYNINEVIIYNIKFRQRYQKENHYILSMYSNENYSFTPFDKHILTLFLDKLKVLIENYDQNTIVEFVKNKFEQNALLVNQGMLSFLKIHDIKNLVSDINMTLPQVSDKLLTEKNPAYLTNYKLFIESLNALDKISRQLLSKGELRKIKRSEDLHLLNYLLSLEDERKDSIDSKYSINIALRLDKHYKYKILTPFTFNEQSFTEKSQQRYAILKGIENIRINAEEYQLRRLFANLLDNGLYWTRERMKNLGIKKSTVIIFLEISESHVIIGVEDSGIGIQLDKKDIFNSFVTGKPVGKGLGFGLTICKKIAENHHSNIIAENLTDKDHGARFSIKLKRIK